MFSPQGFAEQQVDEKTGATKTKKSQSPRIGILGSLTFAPEGKNRRMEEQPSNRAVGALLSRLGYKRRRGRIKTPPLDADRLARIPQFLVQMEPKAPTS